MKAGTIISLLSVAMTTRAAPVMDSNTLEARTGSTCTADGQKPVCCDVGLLNCVVQVAGATCTTSSYCCETKSAVGRLVSINALNCVKVL
jgi:hypothetical protein